MIPRIFWTSISMLGSEQILETVFSVVKNVQKNKTRTDKIGQKF